MDSDIRLAAGAMVALGCATAALVVMPYMEVKDIPPAPGLKPYSAAQLRGREVYIANGCVYCHTQQPRDRRVGPDAARGWGRPSVPGDYVYDKPHLLGSMRTGPDLFNIGVRQPGKDWHLGHLYQPRAFVAGSIMPSFPYLFTVKDTPDPDEQPVALPPGWGPGPGRVVVPTPEAIDLVKYLQTLRHDDPILPAEAAPPGAAPPAKP